MKPSIFLRLAQSRSYWSSRKKINDVRFLLSKNSYQITTAFKNALSNSRSLSAILSVAKGWFLAAVLACAVLTIVDPYLAPYFKHLGVLVPTDTDYVTFLAAIGSIGAVFIGLYYAAIASVGGAIYARVPSNLRDLLAQERFGNLYIRLLAFLTVLCLLLIAAKLSGCERNYTAILFVTIGAGLGVFAFVRLGQRVFNLFDPTNLSDHIFEQLRDRLRMVTAGGYRWQDPSFQNHAYKQAQKTISTLETLLDITAKEPHLNGSPLVALAEETTKFLVLYCLEKSKIPTNSKWFEQVYRHQDWYRTPDHQLSIAIETGTAITPETKGDGQWIEDRLHQVLGGCLQVNASAGRWVNALSVLEHEKIYVITLVQTGHYEAGFNRIACVADILIDALITTPSETDDYKHIGEKLAVADSIAALPITFALAVHRRLQSIKREDVADRLRTISWRNASSIYNKRFPTYSVEQLEYLAPRLEFEEAVEDEIVTPIWYQTDLVMKPEAEAFVKAVKMQTERAKDFYVQAISKLDSGNAPWLSAAFSSRQCEYWNKVERQSLFWENAWKEISLERKFKDLSWPEFDIGVANASILSAENDAIGLMASQIYPLSQQERPESLPDYCGQFLLMTGEAALRALIDPDAPFFKKIFRSYFIGCLIRFEKLRPMSAQDWRWQQEIRIAASTLMDVMDISGYSLLLSQVHDDEASWLEVKHTWDSYLKADDDKESRVKWLCAVVNIAESGFSILPRGILRTTWQRLVSQKLDDLFPIEETYDRWGVRQRRKVENASPLVQAVAEDPMSRTYDGVDIFVALYLKQLKGSDDLDIRGAREDLLSDISEESSERDDAP